LELQKVGEKGYFFKEDEPPTGRWGIRHGIPVLIPHTREILPLKGVESIRFGKILPPVATPFLRG
jgi:hypothetical protein